MSKLTLTVPSSQKAEDWFSFINESLELNQAVSQLIIDFNDVKFLDTDDFVVLACLIESFYINGATIAFKGGRERFNTHLYNVKFKEYWTEGFDRNKFTLSRNRSTLCLWKISRDMIYAYSIYAREYFSQFAETKDLIPLASNIDEVFNNVFDHSKSPVTGYIITQYYPRNNKLSFSICDFGIGIPTSINQSREQGKQSFTDWQAILKSLEKGFSVNSTPRNRGFGLNNILEFTENTNGSLSIISNDGVVEKKAGRNYSSGETKYNFMGTLIKVVVDLNSLEERDESDQLFDF